MNPGKMETSIGFLVVITLLYAGCAPEPGQGKILPEELEMSEAGQIVNLKAEILDTGGIVMEHPVINWTSSNTDVASVDNKGTITAVGSGLTTITAQSGKVQAKAKITVKILAKLEIEPQKLEMQPDTSKTLSLRCLNDKGYSIECRKTTWRSSDEAVAAVDDAGTVSSLAPGSAEITARIGKTESKISVNVAEKKKAKKKSRRNRRKKRR